MERKLAAILAADVVGYTRMVREDEAETLSGLGEMWRDLFSPCCERHGGRIFKMLGDGALVEFGSVVSAVEAAVGIQQAMAKRNEDADRPFALRIGVNLGDIVLDRGDVLGDGVNIAARLEAEAPAGGVLISDVAHGEILGKVAISFLDAGEVSLKNVERPLRVWRWQHVAPVQAEEAGPPDGGRERVSIAVMPLLHMSPDPADEFLADGLSEDIITGLSQVRWFLVIARNSTFTYKGRAVDVKKVGEELGVRYVLEGSVRKAGLRIRVTAQLIDVESGAHIWAERYDRQVEDIFELQDEITETIVGRVEPEVSAVERTRASRRTTEDLGAWECYQRGLHAVWAYTRELVDEGIALLYRAVELDPQFSSAWGYLAYAHYESVIMGWPEDPDAYLRRGLAAGLEGTRRDQRDPVAWFGLGRIRMMMGQADDAIAALETAIALNPSFAHAHHGLGMALTLAGRLDEARCSLVQVERLSPRDPILWATIVVHVLADILAGDAPSALQQARKALQMPRAAGYWPHAVHAAALAINGNSDEARDALALAISAKPDLSLGYISNALPTSEPEGLAPYLDALRALGLPE